MANNPNRAAAKPSGAWAGWVAFAGIMLALIGFFDILQGLTALTNDEYFAVAGGDLLVFDFTAWGWFLLIWGALLILAGLGLFMGSGWARWFGVILAFLNAIAQIAFLSAYPDLVHDRDRPQRVRPVCAHGPLGRGAGGAARGVGRRRHLAPGLSARVAGP